MKNSSWINQDRLNQTLLVFALLVSFLYFLPRWADQNTNSRMDMIVAVVENGTFQIDPYVQNTVDFAKVGAHYYSDKPPGAALLGIPVYEVLRLALKSPFLGPLVTHLSANPAFQATLNANGTGISEDKVRIAISQVAVTYLVATLPTLLLALLLYRFLRQMKIKPGVSLFAVLAYGLLTPAFAYANNFYSHQLSSALLFAAFYLAFNRQKIGQAGRLLLIGFLIGYAVISEYQVVLIAAILFLYTFYQLFRNGSWLKIGWVLLTGLVVMAGWMVYNTLIFGGPFNISYVYSADWTVQHQTGFMSLTYPHLDALWGMTFSLFRGLFLLSPVLLLAFPGLFFWWQDKKAFRAELVAVISIILAMVLFNSSSIMWWGGFSIGPRYFLPAVPFMTLPLGYFLNRYFEKAWANILAAVLAVLSLVSTWGMTLAGQSFPPDTIFDPFTAYAIPNWQAGNIARNLGTLLGFTGFSSLLPLAIILLSAALAWIFLSQSIPAKHKSTQWKIENSSLS
jgi:hypothetical protein